MIFIRLAGTTFNFRHVKNNVKKLDTITYDFSREAKDVYCNNFEMDY